LNTGDCRRQRLGAKVTDVKWRKHQALLQLSACYIGIPYLSDINVSSCDLALHVKIRAATFRDRMIDKILIN
jgi:hypothetical protein